MGHKDFRIVIVGEGAEQDWLRNHMQHAEFKGVLTGAELSQVYANLDLLVFPSETDTFGLVVLEAFASGIPAVVTDSGGPKFTVRHGETGYVANDFAEFAQFTSMLMSQPDVRLAMGGAARRQALATSWDRIFEGMYSAYTNVLLPSAMAGNTVFNVATT
jgi:glycosyltransferase involved in cell wall biosynthesis